MSRSALSPLLALMIAAGCGVGGDEPTRPALKEPVAERLAATSDSIADALDQGDECTAAHRADELLRQANEALDAREIPPAFQEELFGRANELVATINCPPPPPEPEPEEEEEEEKEKKKEDKRGPDGENGENGGNGGGGGGP